MSGELKRLVVEVERKFRAEEVAKGMDAWRVAMDETNAILRSAWPQVLLALKGRR